MKYLFLLVIALPALAQTAAVQPAPNPDAPKISDAGAALWWRAVAFNQAFEASLNDQQKQLREQAKSADKEALAKLEADCGGPVRMERGAPACAPKPDAAKPEKKETQ